LYNNDHLGNPL